MEDQQTPESSEPATMALAMAAPVIAPAAPPDSTSLPPAQGTSGVPALRTTRSATGGGSRASATLLLAAACAVVAASAAAGMALAQGDWATGGIAGGLASLVVAVFYLLASAVRAPSGVRALRGQGSRRAARMLLLGLAGVLVFGALGVAGLRAPNALHLAQAGADEANHDWAGAITEYTLAGARAPGSRDLARTYGEWGDALAQQGQYAQAVQSFFTVLYDFAGVPDMRQGAIDGLWRAYGAWLADRDSASAYSAIIHDIHAGGQAPWCFGPCPATAALLEAQARFQYGQQLDRQQQYNLAIAFFESVAVAAPRSAYVANAHLAAAADYYAIAQQYLTGKTCAQALGSYVQLARAYGDTPQGAKAKAALAQPVAVSGTIVGFPTNPAPTAYLSLHVDGTTNFSDDYSTGLDGKGNFTFAQVRPGRYNLSAAFADGSGRFWQNAKTGDPYFVTVAPLCTINLGKFQW